MRDESDIKGIEVGCRTAKRRNGVPYGHTRTSKVLGLDVK